MNTTTAVFLPHSTRALASIHVLAATTAAAISGAAAGGVASHSTFGYAAAGESAGICYYPNNGNPTTALLLSSSQSSSPQYQSRYQTQYQYSYKHHHDYTHNADTEWLFSINLLYLLLAPLLLRELPAMMTTLDPLIDYLFDGPSSWLAFPGWCAEMWRLFTEEKRQIVSRRRSADALRDSVGKVEPPPRRRTW